MSPGKAVSTDFSSLCDRFLRYEALTSNVELEGVESVEEVRAKLAEIVRENPDGLNGSALKTMLRRALSASFDESAYGFRSFGRFLAKMEDVVRVVPAPATGGDLRVYPASTPPSVAADDEPTQMMRKAKLHKMGYEQDAQRRRSVLERLFEAMTEGEGPFSLGEVHASMREPDDGALTIGNVVKYGRTLALGGGIVAEEGQEEVFFRDRRLTLTLDPPTAESLILAYETTVATRLVATAGESLIDTAEVCAVPGLDPDSKGDLAYCGHVLSAAKRRVAASVARRSA